MFDGSVVRGDFELALSETFARGQVTVVLGPNGSGKTTLLQSISGITALTRGRISLGENVFDDVERGYYLPPEDRPVGLVFQDHRLFPHLDAVDNVAFGPRAQGVDRAQARRAAREWLRRFGIESLADHRPAQLSGGQSQRVALARALATTPGVLLLDEPTAALDVRTRSITRTELRSHLDQLDAATVIVTHDPLEAITLADRLLVLEHGRLTQAGPPAEVARRPRTDYVATLVGLNLHAGVLRRVGRSTTLDLGERGSLVVVAPAEIAAGHRVLAAIRPSAIAVHTERPQHGSARNLVEGSIESIETFGDRVRLAVDARPDLLVDVTPAAVAELQLRPGSPIWLSLKATDIEIYPQD